MCTRIRKAIYLVLQHTFAVKTRGKTHKSEHRIVIFFYNYVIHNTRGAKILSQIGRGTVAHLTRFFFF